MEGGNYNQVSKPDTQSLISAINSSNIEYIQDYIRKGYDISLPNKLGVTPLITACLAGITQIVDILIACGCNLNCKNRAGQTPLMISSKVGYYDIVKLLLWHKAEVNLQDASGMTAVMYAISNGQKELVQLLIDNGANLEIKDQHGRSALLYTVNLLESTDLEVLKNLMADHRKAKQENNAELIKNSELKIRREERRLWGQQLTIDIAKELTERGADINAQDNDLKSAAMIALEKQQTKVVTSLVEKGANLTLADKKGQTIFNQAKVMNIKNPQIVEILNQAQKSLPEEIKQTLNITPLTITATSSLPNEIPVAGTNDDKLGVETVSEEAMGTEAQSTEAAEEIVSTEIVNPDSVDSETNNASTEINATNIINAINDDLPESNPINPTDNADADELQIIDNKKKIPPVNNAKLISNPDACNPQGQTVLMIAAFNGDLSNVNLLLEQGADVNLKDKEGYTALMFAATKGHLDIIRALLRYRVHIDQKNNQGYTAVALATMKNHHQVMKLLIDKGAKINIMYDNKNLLMLASIHGHVEAAKVLVKLGLNPFIKLVNGPSAVEYAVMHKRKKLLQYYKQLKK